MQKAATCFDKIFYIENIWTKEKKWAHKLCEGKLIDFYLEGSLFNFGQGEDDTKAE